jgi:SAM-dependent methyltransferase
LPGQRNPASHPSQSSGVPNDVELARYRRGLRDELLGRAFRDGPRRKFRVIDVGCGDGSFAALFLKHAQVTGVEDQPDDVRRARARGIQVIRSRLDAALARRERGRYDLVLCTQVLEHQPDPHRFLDLLKTLLRPGGIALIEVPSFDRIKASQAAHSVIAEHVGYYTAGTLSWALDGHFSVVSVENGFHGQFLRAIVRRDRVSEKEFARSHQGWLRELERQVRESHGGKVVMWGAGTRGVALMAMSRALREGVVAVVDSDPRKQGLRIPGTSLAVRRPEDLRRIDPDVILISAVTYRTAIERALGRTGFSGRIIHTESGLVSGASPKRPSRAPSSERGRTRSPRSRSPAR